MLHCCISPCKVADLVASRLEDASIQKARVGPRGDEADRQIVLRSTMLSSLLEVEGSRRLQKSRGMPKAMQHCFEPEVELAALTAHPDNPHNTIIGKDVKLLDQ